MPVLCKNEGKTINKEEQEHKVATRKGNHNNEWKTKNPRAGENCGKFYYFKCVKHFFLIVRNKYSAMSFCRGYLFS